MIRRLWLPTSPKSLLQAQDSLLKHFVRQPLNNLQVATASGMVINAVETVPFSDAAPQRTLVLGHGLGSGLGFFFSNIDELSGQFDRIVAFDWLGFGGSDRPKCNAAPRRRSRSLASLCVSDGDFDDPSQAASFFVDSFHEFCKHPATGLDRQPFVLLGHSLGGFLASEFTLQHPDLVKALVLASPAGLPTPPPIFKQVQRAELPTAMQVIDTAWHHNVTPGQIVRLMGRRGKEMVRRMVRSRFNNRWPPNESELIADYLWHITAAPGSGEYAMNSLLHLVQERTGRGSVFARKPVGHRLSGIADQVPIRLMFGDSDWLWHPAVQEVATCIREAGGTCDIDIVPSSGHHLYLDNPAYFNRSVIDFTKRFAS